MEARVEEQLAEFDTEREQLRSRLKKEEAHCCGLQQQVGTLPGNTRNTYRSVVHLIRTIQRFMFCPLTRWRS